MRRFVALDELGSAVGEELGVSDWYDVTQDRVNAFAEATGDTFWLHVDPERAADSSFGSTIAHGLYTLALEPMFRYGIVSFDAWNVIVNYGYDRVRFPSPVPVGSRIRMRSMLAEVKSLDGGCQVALRQTFERQGGVKPVCVAHGILLLMEYTPRTPLTGV